jgi:hypothetical protein
LANAEEAALVRDAAIYPAATLLQVCAHFGGAPSVTDPEAVGRGWSDEHSSGVLPGAPGSAEEACKDRR